MTFGCSEMRFFMSKNHGEDSRINSIWSIRINKSRGCPMVRTPLVCERVGLFHVNLILCSDPGTSFSHLCNVFRCLLDQSVQRNSDVNPKKKSIKLTLGYGF